MMLATRPILACLISLVATPSWPQEGGDPTSGRTFAEAICAQCHGVRSTDLDSPRPNTATFKTIANTPGMTGTAISVWLQTPHKSMPDLIIAPDDRNNGIAYILTLRDRPAEK